MLRIAACLEEHFPHSMANAVVNAARERGLRHDECHSNVEYIVAHGITGVVNEERVVLGSHHYVFEDEHCVIPEDEQTKFDDIPGEYSQLYHEFQLCTYSYRCCRHIKSCNDRIAA